MNLGIIGLVNFILALYALVEMIYTIFVVSPRRKALGQPTFADIWRMRNVPLDIKASGRMNRYEIQAALKVGGVALLDQEIRKKFSHGQFTDWSIDYAYRHYHYNGRKVPGYWTKNEGSSEATVFLYNRRQPAVPKPAPSPVLRPETTDIDEERQRFEAFLKHPSAFWLSPDWEKARETGEPFWMHDPAPVPNRYLPVPEKITQAAEAIVASYEFHEARVLERRFVGGETSFFIYNTPDGDTMIELDAGEYRQARRLALRLSEEQRNNLLTPRAEYEKKRLEVEAIRRSCFRA
jgi:hypothetical protein